MRIVGSRDRGDIEMDPAQAHRRGRVIDGMLRTALPPRARGVLRARHAERNRLDDERQLLIARRLNAA